MRWECDICVLKGKNGCILGCKIDDNPCRWRLVKKDAKKR